MTAATATKKTAAAKATDEAINKAKTDEAVNEQPQSALDAIMQRYNEARIELLAYFGTPDWKRRALSLVAAFVTSFAVGYVGAAIVDWLIAGAVLSGAGTFVALLIYVIGLALTVWAGVKLGTRVGVSIFTGEADAKVVAAYDGIKNFCAKLNPFGAREVRHA
jgi:hypothetical protein